MAGANDLPQEIWELIVAYIPRRDLRHLIQLNRKLCEIVLDKRYRVVSWSDLDSDLVKNDPAIANHVRRLRIHAWSLRKLFGISASPTEGSSPDSHRPKSEFRLWKSLPRFLSLPSPSLQHDSNGVPIPGGSSMFPFMPSVGISAQKKELLALMTKAMSSMTNLKSLVIEWKNLPLNLPASPFLQNIPSSYLCSLTLNTSLSKLRPLLTLLQTPQLEELSLEFEWEGTGGRDMKNEAVLVNVLVPYIKSLAATLRSLRIISQASADHSTFFSTLSYLPHLNHLVLEFPFSKQRFTNLKALTNFLELNAFSLTHLEVLIQREWDRGRELEVESNLVVFYHHFLRMDSWLPKLRSLCITAPPRSCKKSFTQSLLDRLTPTITTLRLAHRYYSQPEITSMVSFISSNVGLVKILTIEAAKTPPSDVLKPPPIKVHEVWTLTFAIGEHCGSIDPLYWPHGDEMPLSKIKWNRYDLGAYLKNPQEETNASWFS